MFCIFILTSARVFLSFSIAQLIPHNISVSAINMIGVGQRAVYVNFTKEGSE